MPTPMQPPAPAAGRHGRGAVARMGLAVGTLGVLAAAWTAVAVAGPADGGPPVCLFRGITGLDCPFCGATRSAAALARGDLALALDQNAFFVLVIVPLAAAAWLAWAWAAGRGRPAPTFSSRLLVGLLTVTGVWWGLRLAVPWLGSGVS